MKITKEDEYLRMCMETPEIASDYIARLENRLEAIRYAWLDCDLPDEEFSKLLNETV